MPSAQIAHSSSFLQTSQFIVVYSFYCGIITYHKEYTPDFLKQKKIKNYGDLEYVQVQGTHEPIVTVEEYEQVQKLMDAKSAVLKNHNKGKRRTGRMQHTTVYGRLMICQCGNKFNLRFHSRDGRTDGVDYQCYTSVNRGSVAKRLNKGISIEHSCESPYIQGWKLEMMAEQVFDRYIENADKVMDLSYAMLEKHIADQEELPDNTDVIRRKQGEIEKLMNKRTNLIEMRAEGDIDVEGIVIVFRKHLDSFCSCCCISDGYKLLDILSFGFIPFPANRFLYNPWFSSFSGHFLDAAKSVW